MNVKKQERESVRPSVSPPEEEDVRVSGGLCIAGARVLHK
jgi:hypothetical protein